MTCTLRNKDLRANNWSLIQHISVSWPMIRLKFTPILQRQRSNSMVSLWLKISYKQQAKKVSKANFTFHCKRDPKRKFCTWKKKTTGMVSNLCTLPSLICFFLISIRLSKRKASNTLLKGRKKKSLRNVPTFKAWIKK